MTAEEAIKKVSEDNKIDMFAELDYFYFHRGNKQVTLDGDFTVKDLKLLIDVFILMEKQ